MNGGKEIRRGVKEKLRSPEGLFGKRVRIFLKICRNLKGGLWVLNQIRAE